MTHPQYAHHLQQLESAKKSLAKAQAALAAPPQDHGSHAAIELEVIRLQGIIDSNTTILAGMQDEAVAVVTTLAAEVEVDPVPVVEAVDNDENKRQQHKSNHNKGAK